jgi:ADP-ribosyl-[dinitrogen reductase] hydrolase
MTDKLNKFKGSIFGLAVGDAIGTAVEFKCPGTFPPVTDMTGGGVFDLKAGEWTDDTSMALCLADSLVIHGWNPDDQIERYVQWWRKGYMSSNGTCFDIGNATRSSLQRYEKNKDVNTCGTTHKYDNGNGSLMRLAPVPLYYYKNMATVVDKSGESSKLTHAHDISVESCMFYGGLISLCVNDISKDNILNKDVMAPYIHNENVKSVMNGSYKTKQPPEIKGSGYVIDSMEAALWAFYHTSTFEEGVLKVVNLGDDADTTGAIYGMLAGAYYGYDAIPSKWTDKIAKKELIDDLVMDLYKKVN